MKIQGCKKNKIYNVESREKMKSREGKDNMDNITVELLVRFCGASAEHLDLGLTTEQLVCLNKECLEIAKYYKDINILVNSLSQLVALNNSMSKYRDSLLLLEELVPLVWKYGDDSNHLITYMLLSITYEYQKLFEDAIACCNMWLAIARKNGDKEAEMAAYLCLGRTYFESTQYDEAIFFTKKCIYLVDNDDKNYDMKEIEMEAYLVLGGIYHELDQYDEALPLIKKYLHFALETNDKSGEMKACECMMFVYEKSGQYDDAILYARKCLDIAQTTDDKMFEMNTYIVLRRASVELNRHDNVILYCKGIIDVAKQTDEENYHNKKHTFFEIGEAYSGLQQYEDAILYYKKCSVTAMETGDKKTEMKVYYLICEGYHILKQCKNVLLYGKKCIDIAKTIGEEAFQMKVYLLLARAHGQMCKYEDAVMYTNKCVNIARIIGSKLYEATAYNLLGFINYKWNLHDQAIAYCEKSLGIFKETDQEKYLDITATIILGEVNKALKKHQAAILYFKKCLDISNEINLDKYTKLLVYKSLGESYHAIKQYDDAVLFHKKCFELSKQIDDTNTEMDSILLKASHLFLNNTEETLLYGKEMLDFAKETGDKQTEMRGHLILSKACMNLSNFGELSLHISEGKKVADELNDNKAKEEFAELSYYFYTMVGMPEEASKFDAPFGKELEEVPTCPEKDLLENLCQARKSDDLKKHITQLVNLHYYYKAKNQSEQAITYLQELKELQLGKYWNLFCYTRIGDFYKSMKQYDKAIQYYEDKIPEARECENKMEKLSFFAELGKLYYNKKEFQLAEEFLREAIRCFELVFKSLGSHDNFKISIFDDYISCYNWLSSLLIKTNQFREALLVSDRCRARALKDRLTLSFGMKQVNDAEHVQYNDIESIVSSNKVCILHYTKCKDGLCLFLVESENGVKLLVVGNPAKDVQALDAVIDYVYEKLQVKDLRNCENRSLDPGNIVNIQEQELSKSELMRLDCTGDLFEGLGSRGETSQNHNEIGYSDALENLYLIMISTVKHLVTQDELVIIPDGPISKVPFSALRDPDTGQYLSQTKRIRLAPSLTTLKYLIDLPKDLYSKKGALVIGDPSVGKVMLDGVERDMPPLEGAHVEAIVIASRLGVTPLIGKHATKPAVIQRLQQGVSVVHIAAHGSLSKATIMLAPSQETRAANMIPEEKDYMLTMADVQEAKVCAQLVVLSCCHSGRGEIRAEGVVGMCRAFLASGARAVVASLWAIDDDATLDFMSLFYFYLKRGESASTSLQLTMNEIRKCERFKKPKYWAPFFLIGDDVTIDV